MLYDTTNLDYPYTNIQTKTNIHNTFIYPIVWCKNLSIGIPYSTYLAHYP